MTEFPKCGSLEALKIQFTFCLMEIVFGIAYKHCLLKCHRLYTEKQWIAVLYFLSYELLEL